MTTAHSVPVWQRALILLSGVVIGFITILGLQWGRPVLIPVALAVLLTFLLNPLVKTLHRRGLNRLISVFLAVSTVGLVLMCLGWMVTRQVSGMLAELPSNTERIKAKVKAIKELGSGPTKDQFGQMIEEISAEFHLPQDSREVKSSERKSVETSAGPIVIQSESTHWLNLTGYLNSAFEVLATLGFALVLLVFFLIEREDLRDRIVVLAGRAKVTVTSKALEDVTDRVSRYIGMVALVNGGFGFVLTCGLLALGVPFALLWGFVAAALRFLPYIGPWIGAVFPITMSLALSDGWWQPIAVLAFVTIVELVTNNVVEPLLFGHTTGVSPTALLVSAAFWLFLWGPIGLVLSAPFAVCLVVLGKNIPQLGFLYVLLGDQPALDVDQSFYQRLMLGDFHEAAVLAVAKAHASPQVTVYDEIFIPALNYTNRDLHRNHLTDADYQSVLEGMRVALTELDKSLQKSDDGKVLHGSEHDINEPTAPMALSEPLKILGCAATDPTDQFALELLGRILDPTRWKLELHSLDTLSSELISEIKESPPAMIFIASIPPGNLAHARYLCKRLRRASADLQIIVGRCGQTRATRQIRERLMEAGASFVTESLSESRDLLNSRFALLATSTAVAFTTEIPVDSQITKGMLRSGRESFLVEAE